MQVKVKLFATLRLNREKESFLDIPDGASVDSILKLLGISGQEAKILIVNGRHVSPEHILKSGDTISLFPLVGGG